MFFLCFLAGLFGFMLGDHNYFVEVIVVELLACFMEKMEWMWGVFSKQSHGIFWSVYHIKVCFFGNEEHEKVNDFLLGWKHWKIVIGYACILARITERGVPFPAAKRLALCGGEEACPLPR